MSEQKQDPIVLRIEGVDWSYWKSVEISLQMDAIAGAFSIALADKWESGKQALPIAAGMECEVLIGSDPVIKGYIDKVSHSLSASDHAIRITGRDTSGDMVDCSAIHKPGHFLNLDVLGIVNALAAPFGISTQAEGNVGAPIPSFKLEQGETAFEALDRALKLRELLACPDGKGGLILLKVGERKNTTALKQGENVLSASADFDMTDRFSDYLVDGQQPGSDEEFGEAAAQVHAETKDSAVKRYRPLLVRAENNVDSATAQKRAAWEKSVRAARSVTVSVTVQGFRQADGSLWQVNALTGVDIPYLRLSGDLLTSKITFKREINSGSTTVLELKDPKAFQPEPQKAESSGGASGTTAPVEKEIDLMERMAADAGSAHSTLKEGK